jgi:hypothetical protein
VPPPPSLSWGGKQIQFPKHCILLYLEFRTMDKAQKPSVGVVEWRCLRQSSWCYWSADGDGWATVVEVGLAWWGVLFSEAQWSQRVDLAGSHLSLHRPAPIAGYIVTYRTCRVSTLTALLEPNVLTHPSHLADWLKCLPLGLGSRYDWRSVSQYALTSSPPWDLRPDINSVWILRISLLSRGRPKCRHRSQ